MARKALIDESEGAPARINDGNARKARINNG